MWGDRFSVVASGRQLSGITVFGRPGWRRTLWDLGMTFWSLGQRPGRISLCLGTQPSHELILSQFRLWLTLASRTMSVIGHSGRRRHSAVIPYQRDPETGDNQTCNQRFAPERAEVSAVVYLYLTANR